MMDRLSVYRGCNEIKMRYHHFFIMKFKSIGNDDCLIWYSNTINKSFKTGGWFSNNAKTTKKYKSENQNLDVVYPHFLYTEHKDNPYKSQLTLCFLLFAPLPTLFPIIAQHKSGGSTQEPPSPRTYRLFPPPPCMQSGGTCRRFLGKQSG